MRVETKGITTGEIQDVVGSGYAMLHLRDGVHMAHLPIVVQGKRNDQASIIAGRVIYGDALLIEAKS